MICLISLSKFWDELPTFTCARAISCLVSNILRLEWLTLSGKPVTSIFIGNILLSKTLRSLSLPS